MRPPLLVLAVGNPSRGDDALGPLLLDRLRGAGVEAAADVELLTDFQLQVEHALDLEDRHAVLFVDAARPGAADGVRLTPLQAGTHIPPASHALSAPAVLRVAQQLAGRAPSAWQLALEGECFDLGAGLSPRAARHLDQAGPLALEWLRTQRARMAHTPMAPCSISRATAPDAAGAEGAGPARTTGG